MPKRKKKIDPWDLACAVNAWFLSSYVSINVIETVEDLDDDIRGDDIILVSERDTPDIDASRKINFNRLSKNAKEIINTVCWGSDEIIQQMQSKGVFKKKKIEKYFRRKWKQRLAVHEAMAEIKTNFLAM